MLQEIVGFLPPLAVGVANHRGNGIDDGFRDGASDFGWKPTEVVTLSRAEANRVIAVVVDSVTGPSCDDRGGSAVECSLVLVVGGSPN